MLRHSATKTVRSGIRTFCTSGATSAKFAKYDTWIPLASLFLSDEENKKYELFQCIKSNDVENVRKALPSISNDKRKELTNYVSHLEKSPISIINILLGCGFTYLGIAIGKYAISFGIGCIQFFNIFSIPGAMGGAGSLIALGGGITLPIAFIATSYFSFNFTAGGLSLILREVRMPYTDYSNIIDAIDNVKYIEDEDLKE
jgi:hypothetical protein